MESEWRPVVGFPMYETNREGEVRNIKTEKQLKGSGSVTSGKYYTLHNNPQQKTMRKNRIIREAFPD